MSVLETIVESSDLGQQECWELLERVAASRQLRRSARLRDFLLFVGTQSLKQGVHSIREQEIGATVFGRPAAYDTSLDNIVRVNASELRKRLEIYFAEEGTHEEIVMEIPRGGYVPVFQHRHVSVASLLATVSAVDPESSLSPDAHPLHTLSQSASMPTSLRAWSWLHILITSTFAALLVVCSVLAWQNRQLRDQLQPWKSAPALESFWSEFFGTGGEIDLVLADTSLALAKDITGQPVSLNDYLSNKYRMNPGWKDLSPDRVADLQQVLGRYNGSFGDFQAAQRILSLAPMSRGLKFFSARQFTAEAIRRNSVILIGSRESNPWVELYKDQLNFSVEYDPATHRSFVTNRTPLPGEKPIYDLADTADRALGYSVIAYLPDINGNGRALILAGTDSQATRAAGEFITNADSLADLRRRFPPGRMPFFELLLQSSQLVGTPMRSEVVALRSHPAPDAH